MPEDTISGVNSGIQANGNAAARLNRIIAGAVGVDALTDQNEAAVTLKLKEILQGADGTKLEDPRLKVANGRAYIDCGAGHYGVIAPNPEVRSGSYGDCGLASQAIPASTPPAADPNLPPQAAG